MNKNCEACGVALIMTRTAKGGEAPITSDVKENGNVLLFRAPDGVIECRSFMGDTLAALRLAGVPLRLNHFADCPDAQRFRTPPKGGADGADGS